MEVGEVDFPDQLDVSGTNISDIPSSGSMDSLFDEIFKNTLACTHAHTCNLPGPDSSHTHRCYHVHTKILPSMNINDGDKTQTDDTAESTEKKGKKRPLGNRVAVKKYREKKKAEAASLEEEVVRLQALNQQLTKRIQSQAALEAEVARLKCLLVDIRGRIEGEIGSFPYHNQHSANHNVSVPNMNFTGGYVMNPCNMQCGDQFYCLHTSVDGEAANGGASVHDPVLNGCEFENLQCVGNENSVLNELPGCGVNDSFAAVNPSLETKRKGARAARSK